MDSVASCSSKASKANACTRNIVIASKDPWSKLDDTVIENILARVLMVDFFQCQLVCKRWDSIIDAHTFQMAAHQLVSRVPWFLMIDSNLCVDTVYDMETQDWRQGHFPMPMSDHVDGKNSTLVASSGKLMCFVTDAGTIIVTIPLTRYGKVITGFCVNKYATAIALHGEKTSYQIFVVLRKPPGLVMKIFSSTDNSWRELTMQIDRSRLGKEKRRDVCHHYCRHRFFSKQLKRGLPNIDSDGKIMVYYINARHRLVKCDTNQSIAYEYPGFDFPDAPEYDLDIVACGGCVYVVILMQVVHQSEEIFDQSNVSLRLQLLKFDDNKKLWSCVA
ncbi:hypothetical protein AQUCO_00200333v1 [Aquilegia coerulea]|uniref:F-box domain-containing protein n=1 Tax=Aquilegia coerulea TaxID=218851 RepID=A0A2G5F2U2_AQUCA|nr:hypothetical protein AQUCO_00200333v1 [Aquilegia coerulea]